MRVFVFIIAILVSIVLQTSLNLFTGGIKPDLLLILVLFVALMEGPKAGLKAGFAVGLVEDLVTGKYLGLSIIVKMITGFLVGLLEPKIFKENYLIPVVTLIVGTILHELLFIFFGNIIGMNIPWGENIWHRIFPLAVYQGIIALFAYVPFYKIYTSKRFKQNRSKI
ncbi:rod shape-determining protein MreD [Dehalobacterium formicoaceticum]|uniref:Rod shape-determining protein MreD n=1 Tax=Dehalobacterium formicoaceticum TaxID=51515 RepID=A0ABT1Y504_9FIRM|nr:rod shape-determining protein MreD [Dehalobacterium formicoaceticum]MCR6545004.1 rod shape-determining protein MreD [Dehalobacterium formicoaceticum]